MCANIRKTKNKQITPCALYKLFCWRKRIIKVLCNYQFVRETSIIPHPNNVAGLCDGCFEIMVETNSIFFPNIRVETSKELQFHHNANATIHEQSLRYVGNRKVFKQRFNVDNHWIRKSFCVFFLLLLSYDSMIVV